MLKSIDLNGIKVYSLSSGKTLPQFITDANSSSTSLRYNEDYKNRLELIQNFDFPVSSQKIEISPDNQFIAAVGIYPPEIRMYDINQLGLKFIRRFDKEIIDFCFLSNDYKKLVFLQENRYLEFHTQGGRHHLMRIPKVGRSLKYSPHSAELYISGTSSNIFRLDLEQGKFLSSFSSQFEEINCSFLSPNLPLIAVGGSTGTIEFFDFRVGKCVSNLFCLNSKTDNIENTSITAGSFSLDGMQIAVGLSNGIIRVYDIRSKIPLSVKDHKNDEIISSVSWIHTSSVNGSTSQTNFLKNLEIDKCLVSTDKSNVKLWDGRFEKNDSINFINEIHNTNDKYNNFKNSNDSLNSLIQPKYPVAQTLATIQSNCLKCSTETTSKQLNLNGCTFYPGSGLCFIPCEQSRVGICYIPSVGIAPKWCSFLDSITEELENDSLTLKENTSQLNTKNSKQIKTVYDDYQFVTKTQLDQMGISQLIGTSLLRAYMHGYFIDAKLYTKIKDILEPFAYQEYRKDKIYAKLEAKKKMRLSIKSSSPIVNKELAQKLELIASKNGVSGLNSKQKKASKYARNILSDKRFKDLFDNPDFVIEPLDGN